jgi:hypothetical protein
MLSNRQKIFETIRIENLLLLETIRDQKSLWEESATTPIINNLLLS